MEKKFSDQGQDVFVTNLVKSNGFFLDIGAANGISGNNTYLLESLGWDGISIEANHQPQWENRKTRYIIKDALSLDYYKFLEEQNCPKIIDYISMDIDNGNFDLIQKFPFDEYSFKILTFEHNQCEYVRVGYPWPPSQNVSLHILSRYPKYVRLAKDVKYEGRPFEDWWINTDFFRPEISSVRLDGLEWQEIIEITEKLKIWAH